MRPPRRRDLGLPGPPPIEPGAELVVLVHGMGRTSLSMAPLTPSLRRAGFDVLNWGYPSRTRPVREAGELLALLLDGIEHPADGVQPSLLDPGVHGDHDRGGPPARIHFVGHSLGAIVVRWVLAHRPSERYGRVVMIASPNQGAAAADRLERWFTWFLRPLPDLTTDRASTARTLRAPAGIEIGVIAGARDRKVRVQETFLPEQSDHAVVRGGHTFLMARPRVQALTERFLRTGRFS